MLLLQNINQALICASIFSMRARVKPLLAFSSAELFSYPLFWCVSGRYPELLFSRF